MAGIYIHIPFCRKACSYCDFHFSISLKYVKPMLVAIQKELSLRKNELEGEKIATLYIGGGTPSILSTGQIQEMLECVRDHYEFNTEAEVTLEANPDDLNMEYLKALKELGINRLSIGIQSFHDADLKLLSRSHNGGQAESCLENAVFAGFDNLNIDLIYGLPGSNPQKWKENLEQATRFLPGHISAYHLSYESGSVLKHRKNKGRVNAIDENESLDQFNMLTGHLEKFGYMHYEISNFARDDYMSRHNMAYWTGKNYLGFGPSAHSYYGHSRRWNLSRNSSYLRAIQEGGVYHEQEILDSKAKYHDYLITNLRTRRGIDLELILKKWGPEYYKHFNQRAAGFIKNGRLLKKGNIASLSREGMFISDYIISDLFMPA